MSAAAAVLGLNQDQRKVTIVKSRLAKSDMAAEQTRSYAFITFNHKTRS